MSVACPTHSATAGQGMNVSMLIDLATWLTTLDESPLIAHVPATAEIAEFFRGVLLPQA